jgi:hypothetical protein
MSAVDNSTPLKNPSKTEEKLLLLALQLGEVEDKELTNNSAPKDPVPLIPFPDVRKRLLSRGHGDSPS